MAHLEIYVPKRPPILLPRPVFSGHYLLKVYRRGRCIAVAETDNLITNAGLEQIGIGSSVPPTRYCVVGTGNTAPSVSDPALQTPIARVDGISAVPTYGVITTGNRYGYARKTYTFAVGAVVGNIAEVGVGWNNTNSTPVFSRSLVSPVISVLITDQLIVVYELRMYLPTADVVGSQVVNGTSHGYTIRPMKANSSGSAGYGTSLGSVGWAHKLLETGGSVWVENTNMMESYKGPCELAAVSTSSVLAVGGASALSNGGATSRTNETYVGSSLQADFSFRMGPTTGNDPLGIGGVQFSAMFGTYQMIISPVLPKTSTQEFILNLRQSWARRP